MKTDGEIRIFLAATSGGHLTEGLALFGGLSGTKLIVFSEYGPRMETLDCEHYGYRRIKSPVLTMIPSFFKSLYLGCYNGGGVRDGCNSCGKTVIPENHFCRNRFPIPY